MTYTPIVRGTDDWDAPLNAALSDQDTRITTNTSGLATANSNIATNTSNIATNTTNIATNTSAISTLNTTVSGHTTSITALQGQINPAAVQGLVAWNYDSESANSTNTLTLGTIFMNKVYLPAGVTVNGLGFTIPTTVGASLTYARAGLYNSSGTQVALSNDQTTNWTSTGYKVNTLSSPYVVPSAGFYWVAFLATGTTAPVPCSSNGVQMGFNGNVTGATLRHGTAGTGQTSLPASITMSSMVSTGASIWTGLN